MIRINLLAERKLKKQKKSDLPLAIEERRSLPFLTLLGIVSGAALLLAVLTIVFLKMQVSNLKSEYAANQVKIAEYKKKIDEVKKFEALNKAIQLKSNLIETLKKNQSAPVKLLDDISKLLPDGIWLSSVTFNNPQAIIEGVGYTNMDVVSFVDNLKKSPAYSDVYLEETKQGTVEKTDVYNFKLNFKVKI
ncbi:MAG TPA: PilN domain-containing protein [Dissulfurispiraceae bacterium]|nr:PilN domain-containing protein [Dissulfurispiraceae bacterium]